MDTDPNGADWAHLQVNLYCFAQMFIYAVLITFPTSSSNNNL
jgi:hypothetical protein